MSSLKYWVWLSQLQGLTAQARIALINQFGTPEEIFYADELQLQSPEVINHRQITAVQNHDMTQVNEILGQCEALGIEILTWQDAHYPHRLRNIFDPPCVLYVKGRLPLIDEQVCVAVVGTRDVTPYGTVCAEKLGYGLAKGGAIVVSGLAKGADSAAIRGALRGGGITIGVVGNGLDVTYPWESAYLYQDVVAQGALISEYPPGTPPHKTNFPARNRILSGLCLSTLVVEAPVRSGALITARTALDQGRDVFAVPGPIEAPCSKGCNLLIQEGAGLVCDAWDILHNYVGQYPGQLHLGGAKKEPQVLGYAEKKPKAIKEGMPMLDLRKNDQGITDDQICVLRAMGDEPMELDDIIDETQLPTRRVLSAISLLDLEGYVKQQPGEQYLRTVTLVN